MDGRGGAAATFVAVGGAAVGAGAHAVSAATAVNVIPAEQIVFKHGRFIVRSPFNCFVGGCKKLGAVKILARAPAPSHLPKDRRIFWESSLSDWISWNAGLQLTQRKPCNPLDILSLGSNTVFLCIVLIL